MADAAALRGVNRAEMNRGGPPPRVVFYRAMASAFSHAIAAASIGTAFWRPGGSIRLLALGVLFSIVPDVDVVGFSLGIQYGDVLGHRGLTHSLAFAVVMATMGSCVFAGHS